LHLRGPRRLVGQAEELKVIAAAARSLGLRLRGHLSETNDYVEFCLNAFDRRPVHSIALGPDVWFAHEGEIALLVVILAFRTHSPGRSRALAQRTSRPSWSAAASRSRTAPSKGPRKLRRAAAGGHQRIAA